MHMQCIAKRAGAAVRLWSRDSFGSVWVNIIMVHIKLGAVGDAIGNQASRPFNVNIFRKL